MLRRPRVPLLIAASGLSLLVLVHVVAFGTNAGRRVDAHVLEGFFGLDKPRTRPLADALANLASPKPFVVLALVIVGVALARRRPRGAAAAAIVLVLANLTTQFLKPALASPRTANVGFHIDAASWPSGHATASMSLVLAAVLVTAPRWRPWIAALGAGYTVAVVYSFLTLAWHFPSDVLGGYLVAATWMAFALAGLAAAGARWPEPGPSARPRVSLKEAVTPVVALVVAAAAVALLVVLARPRAVVDYARAHTLFVVGALTIGALGLSLAAGLVLSLRRSAAGPPT